MICEKCGKEIPENETFCPDCNEAAAMFEQPEVIEEFVEEIAEVTEETVEEPTFDPEEFGVPVSTVIRKKRGKARVVTGIVALVIMAAVLVTSFLNPILLIGSWKVNQTLPTGMGTDFQLESTMLFTASGKVTLSEALLNWEELGFPEDQSKFSSSYYYTTDKGDLILDAIPEEGEEVQLTQSFVLHCDVTPNQFSYWEGEATPREVYDYYRDGYFYPSMILWMVAAVLLVLGVLLLAIPGKKHEVTTYEEALENDEEDFEEFLEEIYEEIEADMEGDSEEVFEEIEVTEETEVVENTEE